MPQGWIDLHTHSNVSDGTDTPAELVAKAAQQSLQAIALTDHDSIAGLWEAEQAANTYGIRLVRGCELSASWQGYELHFIAYYIPQESAALENILQQAQSHRLQRNAAIIERLQELGIGLSMQALEEGKSGVIGRPYIAGLLQQQGVVRSMPEAFERFLGKGGAAYVPLAFVSAEERVRSLVALGLTVSWAHPCLLPALQPHLPELVATMKLWGLHALEAYHSSHSRKQVRQCLALANKHKLLLTGGSDYHGNAKYGVRLGTAGSKQRIPHTVLAAMDAQRRQSGLWV